MANYLISHYKGKYRIKCEYDQITKQFQRKLNGTYEDMDCYVDCYKNIKIFHYGRSVLEAYIPSVIRGRNIIKAVEGNEGKDIISDVTETDSEVSFRFRANDLDKLAKYLKPKTSGANISPFSSKNLPKNKSYKISDEEFAVYKEIVEQIGKNRIIELTHITNSYLKSLVTKTNTWDDIKADMALKELTGKNYIHAIGKWREYTMYLKNCLII